MLSEHRLHPASVVFAFLSQIRAFVVPGALVLIGAQSSGGDWQPWMMLLVVPNAIVAILRYATYRYRYEPSEMVIQTGLLFRRERHVPYARIQNIDAVQRPLHRLLNVVEVRIETGGGRAPEATMSVLPAEALGEMRARVFAERHAEAASESFRAVPHEAPAEGLLHLDLRDLLLCGVIENRGTVVIAAAIGLVMELGLFDSVMEVMLGEGASGRGVVRDLVRTLASGPGISLARLMVSLAALLGLFVVLSVVSMAWAVVRLYGFRVTLDGDDLRSEFGLLTRVTATIPRHRIQTLTVREGPLHRLFKRAALKADTAGGPGPARGAGQSEREWLAPLIERVGLAAFVRVVSGGADLSAIQWMPVAARAFRRELKGWLVLAALAQTAVWWLAAWWSLLTAPALLAWAVIGARRTIAHLGWAVADEAIWFRTGWLWRRVSVVRFAKIQTVTLAASPFDRRTGMARLRVDTAGRSENSRVDIPYLPRDTAVALHAQLVHEAARKRFTW